MMKFRANYKSAKIVTGNDQLKGGAGADVYKLSGTYGTDTITDSDGVGIITVDNVALTGGTQVPGNIYRNESQKYTYTLAGSGDAQSLFIQKDGTQNKIIIRNWTTANNLNITLQDQAIEEKPVTLGGDSKTIKTQNKALNSLPCNPHGYWLSGHLSFSLATQKTASNDKVNFAAGERECALGYNKWRIAA
jgi:hypothetical protein